MQCCLRAWGGAWFLFLCVVVSLGPAPPCEAKATSLLRLTFHREVVNLEGFAGRLTPFPPEGLKNGPVAEGDLWFGSILRRLPDDDPTSREHDAFFAVQFQGLSPVRAWCDTNLDGDLSNDALIPLSVFPGKKPARSFLSDLRWTASRSGKKFQVDRLVRVILEFPDSTMAPRSYRTQDVYGMLGKVDVEGVPRLALLFDGNHDGIYGRGGSDGVFLDLDGDRHFNIDIMSPDFAPFALPVSLGRTRYDVIGVDETGSEVDLRAAGPSTPIPPPSVGKPVHEFPYVDTTGRHWALADLRGRAVVVYFWSSWCGGCNRHANALRELYERYKDSGVEILGVSYDTNRKEMDRFRKEHRHVWPTSFSGGYASDDPTGRAFREDGSGMFYLIGSDGRLVAKTSAIDELELHLSKLVTTGPSIRSER